MTVSESKLHSGEEARQAADALQPACSSSCALPTPVRGEPMTVFFQRLKAAVQDAAAAGAFRRVDAITEDGVYLHKRPVRTSSGAAPLAACGSVFHHCVVYVRQGGTLHALDYAPANGSDVTANLLEEFPSREVHAVGACVPPDDTLPFLYLGPATQQLEERQVQAAIAYARSRNYHAVLNNCVHFADFMVRLLTGVESSPLIYDALCGEVPAAESPLFFMIQMMLQRCWSDLCDGAALLQGFLAAAGTTTAAQA